MEGIFGGRLIETAYRRIQRGLLQEDAQYSNKLRGKINRLTEVHLE